jgi:hypothetical protein
MPAVPGGNMHEREQLLKELLKAAEQTGKYGWRNYVCAYVVAGLAVGGSMTATILAAVKSEYYLLTAIVAAIPAAVIAVNTTFNFERKALWHWRTTKRFEGLIRKLHYETTNVAEVSREFSKVDQETFDGWMVYSTLSKESEAAQPAANVPPAGGEPRS